MKRQTLALAAVLALIAAICFPQAPSQDVPRFSLSLTPSFSIPMGSDIEIFGYGGGADLAGRWRLKKPNGLFVQTGLGYSFIPIQTGTTISLLSAGAGAGLGFPLGKKLTMNGSAQGGYYYTFWNEDPSQSGYNPFAAGGAGLTLTLSPGLSLEAGAAYRYFFGFYNDIAVSLGASFRFLPKRAQLLPEPLPNLLLSSVQFDTLFPVFFKYYDDHPVGKALLRNNEKEPIENIKVSLFVKQYMDNPKQALAPAALQPGEEQEIVFQGLFTDRVLDISEETKVSAQITVSCAKKGRAYANEYVETIRLHDRNAMTWEDDRRAAAFVTMKDPTLLRLSKGVAAAVKGKACGSLPESLLNAMAMHAALALYGMGYVVDPTTPHKEFSQNRTAVDYLQFPKQTLQYKAGDCDDLSILYCALLESIGIETAFITVPGHIFMAFSLAMSPEEAKGQFLFPEDFIFTEDGTWLPVEVTEIGGGFLKAWELAARQWREHSGKGQANLYPLHEAWKLYEPVGFSGEAEALSLPPEDRLLGAFQQEAGKLANREITPRAVRLQDEIRKSQDSLKLVNKLGVLYAQYCLNEKAKEQFQKTLAKGDYLPALVNLGNLSLLGGSLPEALGFFERALRLAPDNPKALLGLARVHHAMENYGSVKPLFDKLKKADPALAQRFSYLDLKGEEAVRAAQASALTEVAVWEE